MLDKRGTFLEKGQSASVPEPKKGDKYKTGFCGIIIDILENRGSVIVEDQCGEAFEIEAERVTIED